MRFQFYDENIGLITAFLETDPTGSGLRPAHLVRSVELIVTKSFFIHLDRTEQSQSPALSTYNMDVCGRALCDTLPKLLREINDPCHIVLRFEKDLRRVKKSPLRKVDHAHALFD
jgi:hypothetical protein